ncbi:hypothetical protein C9374_005640 [Naegleria lovaniensis]|uniref:Fungal lipase-type domain-containing protein n=1 Tax=Naegleria lovaniensis TaxID=51637 RepID=A0AA88GQQ6_NAELO|nr:uncharacterized protein C9374_005640 [Naegleria lovaniensis]KAG2382438.1 hypothetical protein C9374_005640 [Naegleria lovaniensis]
MLFYSKLQGSSGRGTLANTTFLYTCLLALVFFNVIFVLNSWHSTSNTITWSVHGARVQGRFFSRIASRAKQSFNRVRSTVRSVKQKASASVKRVISRNPIVNKVKQVAGKKLDRMMSGVKKLKNSVKRGISKVKQDVKKFKTLVKTRGLKKGLSAVKNKLRSKVRDVKGKLKSKAKKIKDKVKSKVRKIKEKVKSKVRKIKDKVKTKVRKVKEKVKSVKQKIKQAKAKIKSKVKKVKESLKNKLQKLKSKVGKISPKKVIQTVKKTLNKVKESVKKTIKTFKTKDSNIQTKKVGSLKSMKSKDKVVGSITAGVIKMSSLVSEAAYENSADKKLTDKGYQLVLQNDHKSKMIANKVFYNPKDKTLVVTYRGTVPNSVKDWTNNFDIPLTKASFGGKSIGSVNRGYLKQYNEDRNAIQKTIQEYQKRGLVDKVVFTGHSKGGALSQLAAADYKLNNPNGAKVEVVTFGSPRVGDDTFAKTMNEQIPNHARVVNKFGKDGSDVFTSLPPKWSGYSHAGNEIQMGCDKSNGVSCHRLKIYQENSATPE